MNDEIEVLRNVPIFGELSEKELERIAQLGVRKKYKKGSIILLEEETGAALFVIISGKVKIVRMDDDGREVILSILGESDFFGEMAILDGLTRSASVVATSKSELFMIHRGDFLKSLSDYPSVAVALLWELTARLKAAIPRRIRVILPRHSGFLSLQRTYRCLTVYNLLGEEVATLFNGVAIAGEYQKVVFDAAQISGGI